MNEDLATQRVGLKREDYSVTHFWIVSEEDYHRMKAAEELVSQLGKLVKDREGS